MHFIKSETLLMRATCFALFPFPMDLLYDQPHWSGQPLCENSRAALWTRLASVPRGHDGRRKPSDLLCGNWSQCNEEKRGRKEEPLFPFSNLILMILPASLPSMPLGWGNGGSLTDRTKWAVVIPDMIQTQNRSLSHEWLLMDGAINYSPHRMYYVQQER